MTAARARGTLVACELTTPPRAGSASACSRWPRPSRRSPFSVPWSQTSSIGESGRRSSASLHGLDAVSFAVVAPLAGAAGVLSLRGRPLGALLGFAPAAYAFYMAPQ